MFIRMIYLEMRHLLALIKPIQLVRYKICSYYFGTLYRTLYRDCACVVLLNTLEEDDVIMMSLLSV